MKDFFISFTSTDRHWAEWVAWQLEAAGYSIIFQGWDFRPGSNFVLEMQKATAEAERTIIILSAAFLKSAYAQPEWAAAFARDPQGTQGLLIPVRVEAIKPEGLLSQVVYIDLVGKDESDAKNELIRGVQKGRVKPKTAPAFPTKEPITYPGITSPVQPELVPHQIETPTIRSLPGAADSHISLNEYELPVEESQVLRQRPLTRFKNWGTRLGYRVYVLYKEFASGIRLRQKAYGASFLVTAGLMLLAYTLFISGIFLAWDSNSFRWLHLPAGLENTIHANRIPLTILFSFFSIGLTVFCFRRLLSKEFYLRVATRRLHGQGRNLAISGYNAEAETLIERIEAGKASFGEKDYRGVDRFLARLWSKYVKDHDGLSMLTYPAQPYPLPVVCVKIDHLEADQDHPEKQLNSLLRVDSGSNDEFKTRFPDFSKSPVGQENLLVRKPWGRYLRRYKGATSEQLGFEDDYVGFNVCLNSMNFKNGKLKLPVECSLELYGNIMDSSDALMDELYMQFAHEGHNFKLPYDAPLDFMPWRKRLHQQYNRHADVLTDVRGRAAGFGIAALTVYNQDGEYVALLGKRTTKVGTYPNTFHVIPSGMSNVNKSNIRKDDDTNKLLLPNGYYNIQKVIEKEFLEEVFSKPWAQHCKAQGKKWHELVTEVAGSHLYGKNGQYQTKMYLTGIVFDLLNYRPEICILILIKGRDWWDDHGPTSGSREQWGYNFEWSGDLPGIDIFDDQAIQTAMPANHSVLSGVAAFHLGVQKAKQIIQEG